MSRGVSFLAAAAAAIAVTACSFEHKSSGPAGLSPSSAQQSAAQTFAGTWSSQSLTTGIDVQSCGNFQWQVTSQTSTSMSGTFSGDCAGGIHISGSASGHVDGTSVPVTITGTGSGGGFTNCAFTLSGTGVIVDANTLRIPYSGTTCVGPVSGTETLHRPSTQSPSPAPTPAPAPAPTPAPAPAPSPAPTSGDQIALAVAAIVKGPSNIASWPVTSQVTQVIAQDGQLCIYHTKLGQWPSTAFFGDPGTLVEGNQWVVANIGGRWYAGAADWYRPGQACKAVDANSIGRDAFYNPSEEPLHSWVPQPGETFGVFSSTPARVWPDMRTLDERTNVVLVRWGG